jgi:hypothetical protein
MKTLVTQFSQHQYLPLGPQQQNPRNLTRKPNSGDLGIYGRVILKRSSVIGGVEWTDMAQDRDKWRASVYTIMQLRFP